MNKKDFLKILNDLNEEQHGAQQSCIVAEIDVYDGNLETILKAMEMVYNKTIDLCIENVEIDAAIEWGGGHAEIDKDSLLKLKTNKTE